MNVQTRLEEFLVESRTPGVSVALVGGDDVRVQTAGFADPATGRPVRPSTRFRIGSVTKTFTAAAVLQLRDEGRLRLDDPLTRFLPEFAEAKNPFGPIEDVTIRRLLAHEGGVPVESPVFDWASRSFPDGNTILASLDRVTLAVPPETDVKYSNFGYQLLGEVIARCSGMPYRRWVSERLLSPLGMNATAFELGSQAAAGHDPPGFTDDPRPSEDRPKATDADGGLCSTAEDLGRWIRLHLSSTSAIAGGAQVLAGTSLAEMRTPRRILDSGWTQAMGLGWRIYRRGGAVLVGHAGGTFGFSAKVMFSPALGAGVVALANRDGSPVAELADALFADLWGDTAAGEDRPEGTSSASAPLPEAYAGLLGLYAWNDLSAAVRVEWRAGALWLVPLEARRHPEPQRLDATEDPLVFTIRGGRETGEPCRFRQDPNGSVVGLTVSGWPLVRLRPAEEQL